MRIEVMGGIMSELHCDLPRCPRCNGRHKDVAFKPLTNPTDEWEWWALCPILKEPVLIKVLGPAEYPYGATGGDGANHF